MQLGSPLSSVSSFMAHLDGLGVQNVASCSGGGKLVIYKGTYLVHTSIKHEGQDYVSDRR